MRIGQSVIVALVWLTCCFIAHAQSTPPLLLERTKYLAAAEQTPAFALNVAARNKQARARSILGAGAGLVLSSFVTLSYALARRSPCYPSTEQRGKYTLAAAGVVGGIGFAGIIGGVSWLRSEVRNNGRLFDRRQRLAAAGTGALAFVLTQAGLGALFVGEMICSN